MHYLIFVYRSDGFPIPVPGTTRFVRVRDGGNGKMVISTSRPDDIPTSEALSVWGDQSLERLMLFTDRCNDECGPPYTATREEWEILFQNLYKQMPTFTGDGQLYIHHGDGTGNWYDELLVCLPPVLHRLLAVRGMKLIRLTWGRVSGKAVLAFMATLHQMGLSVETGLSWCEVGVVGGKVRVCLFDTKVVGSRTTLDETGHTQHGLLHRPTFEEADSG